MTLNEELTEIRALHVREDYAANVKRAFREHFETLEPDATIEDTHYFNHSAIPDFKITWGRGSAEKAGRDIFLRSSYAAVLAADETARIKSGDPVFLSISSTQVVDEPDFRMDAADVARAARQSSHLLLTDVSAVDEISSPTADENPLSAVVRSNFLRGARGLIDEPVAEQLTSFSHTSGNVTELIKETFFEDAVFRMERTAQLVQWALEADDETSFPELEGSMSTAELRSILPWLLRQSGLTTSPGFWASLGGLFNFDQLEEIGSDLEGIDLSPLFTANAETWGVRRAYLGLNIPGDEDGDRLAGWRYDSGTLGLASGEFMVRVSNSGYKVKARPGSSTPNWQDAASRLDGYHVQSVAVSGIERALRVDARDSTSIRGDVDKVIDSVDGTYYLDRVEVLLPTPENEDGESEARSVDVDFAGGLALAGQPVQLGPMVAMVLQVLGNRA